jgi:membrane-bound serine protease (ClpP class)
VLRGISNPNIAYILLMIGLAGLYFELAHPGAVLPGVIGAISLVTAFYALQTMPVNYAGFLFILLAIIFFILEIKIVSYGMLSLAGVLCLVLGSLMLFRVPGEANRLALSVLLPTVSAVRRFCFGGHLFALMPLRTGPMRCSGRLGVKGFVSLGKVFVGQVVEREADEPIPAGSKVRVLDENLVEVKDR